MKNKKRCLPCIILVAAILATAVCMLIGSIECKPTVTEGEFPFSVTYELDGETITLEDVYAVQYVQNDEDDNGKERVYVGKCLSTGEDDRNFILQEDENSRVEFWTHFYPDYLMGDPQYDYFDDEIFAPQIYYFDANENEYYDEETLAAQGVKLISFDYPTPIENSLVFSRFSCFNGEIVFPTVVIALLALIATIIFVTREKELKRKTMDIVSVVLNYIIGTVYLGFVTILALLIDIDGGGSELYYQIAYFVPAVSLWCITASVALRRKGRSKSSLFIQLVGPMMFVIYLCVFYTDGAM